MAGCALVACADFIQQLFSRAEHRYDLTELLVDGIPNCAVNPVLLDEICLLAHCEARNSLINKPQVQLRSLPAQGSSRISSANVAMTHLWTGRLNLASPIEFSQIEHEQDWHASSKRTLPTLQLHALTLLLRTP